MLLLSTMLTAVSSACGQATSAITIVPPHPASLSSGIASDRVFSSPFPVTPTPSGGTVTLSDWNFPQSCNPVSFLLIVNQELCAGVWDNLFLLDNTLHPQPDLSATMPTLQNGGVQIVNGNMLVTYTLKPHLAWSDGSPLTMDDFAFSYNVETAMGNQLYPVLVITQTTPTTVTVLYSGVHADFLSNGVPSLLPMAYLETKYGTTDIPTIAATLLNDPYNSPSDVFSGPYMIGGWNYLQSVTLVPNPYYRPCPQRPAMHALTASSLRTLVAMTRLLPATWPLWQRAWTSPKSCSRATCRCCKALLPWRRWSCPPSAWSTLN